MARPDILARDSEIISPTVPISRSSQTLILTRNGVPVLAVNDLGFHPVQFQAALCEANLKIGLVDLRFLPGGAGHRFPRVF
jgi:hypothetical protein